MHIFWKIWTVVPLGVFWWAVHKPFCRNWYWVWSVPCWSVLTCFLFAGQANWSIGWRLSWRWLLRSDCVLWIIWVCSPSAHRVVSLRSFDCCEYCRGRWVDRSVIFTFHNCPRGELTRLQKEQLNLKLAQLFFVGLTGWRQRSLALNLF